MVPLKVGDKRAGFLILLLIVLLFCILKPDTDRDSRITRPFSEKPVFIQIDGEIKYPGVYSFSHRPNLRELMERAEGPHRLAFNPEALKDVAFSSGQSIVIRTDHNGSSVSQGEMSSFLKLTLGIPISINRESEVGLTAIPGIGPVLARAIVQKRSEKGCFNSLDEIMVIKGIGPGVFSRIRPYLTL